MNNNSEFIPVECLNVPKMLFYDKQYEDLSVDAKLIYVIDVQDPGNALDALMFVLAIDAEKCSRN